MTSDSPDRTISIPVSAATHVAIGCVIALLALTAFFVYTQLPARHGDYRGGALSLGILAGVGALTYWLWCTSQCLWVDIRANAVAIEDARAELRTAKAEMFAKVDALDLRIDIIAEDITENRGSIKEVTDALGDVAKGLKALRECYLQEGLNHDPLDPPETWLATARRPRSRWGSGPSTTRSRSGSDRTPSRRGASRA
jgi:hypothetical protein